LKARGIHLLVVPVPGKPWVYPEMLTSRSRPGDLRTRARTGAVIDGLSAEGVEVVNLFDVFARARGSRVEPLYLMRDTHWTNRGARLAAEAVASRIRALGWAPPASVDYERQALIVGRAGDLPRMLKSPLIDSLIEPEPVRCERVLRQDNAEPYQDDPASPILVLGDSFLRIYERDEPGSAGFISHLACELGLPLASIVNDGGASTLVRQELSRKPALLEGKRLVIWEFVERDVRFGLEGWQEVALTTRPSSAADQ
jgi:hypothetical protein